MIPILNKINYNKFKAIKNLKEYFDWEEYEGKHYGQILQNFINHTFYLKNLKWIKRKSHLSALIRANQITKREMLK